MRILVTGGAGFIGSHIADALIVQDNEVTVLDSLVAGSRKNVNPEAEFVQEDILGPGLEAALRGMDAVFHAAASPDVRGSALEPVPCFKTNAEGTLNLLEACRKAGVKRVVFCSTSTVYGEAAEVPTPEGHPCAPVSNYGASKLACEAYLSSYSATYGMKCTALRYANIYGERSTHGVMYDFYNKLVKSPKELEILGDGKQEKSYLHVSDCVSGTLVAFAKQKAAYDVFNVGSAGKRPVDDIARLVASSMGLKPSFRHTGGKAGWKGDVPVMLLGIRKLGALGWMPAVALEDGVRGYIEWLGRAHGNE